MLLSEMGVGLLISDRQRQAVGCIQADRIFHLFRERFEESSRTVLNWIGGKDPARHGPRQITSGAIKR